MDNSTGHFLDTERVRRCIKLRKSSVKEIAQKLCISPPVLSAKISQHRKWQIHEIEVLCRILKTSPRLLWSDEVSMPEPFMIKMERILLEDTDLFKEQAQTILDLQEKLQQHNQVIVGLRTEAQTLQKQTIRDSNVLVALRKEVRTSQQQIIRNSKASASQSEEIRTLKSRNGALSGKVNKQLIKITEHKKEWAKDRSAWVNERKKLEKTITQKDEIFNFVASVLEIVLTGIMTDFCRTRLIMLHRYLLNQSVAETLWHITIEDRHRLKEVEKLRKEGES